MPLLPVNMTDKISLPSKSPLGFSPAASIDRFLALHRSTQRLALPALAPETRNLGSAFTPRANMKTVAKKRKTGSTTPWDPSTKTDQKPQPQPPLQLQKEKRDNSKNSTHRNIKAQTQNSIRLGCTTSSNSSAQQSFPPLHSPLREASEPIETDNPRPPRPPDPLPPPTSDEHRYIISTRLLQSSTLSKALRDQDLCRLQFIERDVEYLRSLLPIQTRNRDKTRVDVDIIVDEKNGILLYPLREIGQRDVEDPDAGLNELVACIERIGPRYKVLWIIFEEYTWRSSIYPTQTTASTTYSFSGQPSAALPCHPLPRIDPYSGPVMIQLQKLMSWIPTTTEARSWTLKMSHKFGDDVSDTRENNIVYDLERQAAVRFQSRILFASDERSAARISRAIGERIAQEIENTARRGIRREEDGWRDKDEWLWRDWMNDKDSTHEQFLACFQVFNLFSIQLILSLCSLKEFMRMNHGERVKTVGKFVGTTILAKFENIVTTPLV